MTIPFIQFAFTGGELSKKFLNRSDVEKFSLGLRKAENWIVDYQGGVRTRPPLEFRAFTDTTNVRLSSFEFNVSDGNTYILVWDEYRLRFMQDGDFLVDGYSFIQSYSVGVNNRTKFVSSGHGLTTGQLVYINWNGQPELEFLAGYEFVVTVVNSNEFYLTPATGNPNEPDLLLDAGLNILSVNTIYSITTPYSAADLSTLAFDQYRDEVRITTLNHPPYKLARLAATIWTLTEIDFAGNRDAPGAPVVAISQVEEEAPNIPDNWLGPSAGVPYNPDAAVDEAGVIYAVTAVDLFGQESYVADMTLVRDVIDITNNAGSIRVLWAPVGGAVKYIVYRSVIIPRGHEATIGLQLGYLGETVGTDFVDNNIVPDFTRSPLNPDNPFADGAVLGFDITTPGAGYTDAATISIADGTGFAGLPIINSEGQLSGVRILSPGSGYSRSSTVTITDASATTAATIQVRVSPASGNNPRAIARYEQRNIYGGTANLPMTLFFERVASPDNFDFSGLGLATDALELTLDSPQLTPIHSFTGTDLGLVCFTEKEIFHIYGTDDQLITASSARPVTLSRLGAADILPIKVDTRVMFLTADYGSVRVIEPTNLRNAYQTVDISIFSEHLFRHDNKIISWAYADAPQRQLWVVFEDGSAACLTYVPDQNVYAWTPQSTRGKFKDVCSVKEGGVDRLYFTVERERNGLPYLGIERLDLDYVERGERVFALDNFREPRAGDERYVSNLYAGVTVLVDETGPGNRTDITIQPLPAHARAEGDYLRTGGGLFRVRTIEVAGDSLNLHVDVLAESRPSLFQQVEGDPKYKYTSYEWNTEIDFTRGQYHLKGEYVDGVAELAQLEPMEDFSVENYSFPAGVTRPYFGLNYVGDLVTLPLALSGEVIQNLKKRPTDITITTIETTGLEVGTVSAGDFYELTNTTFNDYELRDYMLGDLAELHIGADWREDDAIVIRKSQPFRATVLGFAFNSEIGSD